MSLEHFQMSAIWEFGCRWANAGFTIFFLFEALVKVAGLGWAEFWESGWNRFDVFVVTTSLISLAFEFFGGAINANPTLLRILRVVRVTRLVRVFNASLGLQALLNSIIAAVPAVMNVALIMILLFFVYACAGVEMFGRQGCTISGCEGILKHGSFKNWPYAMLTLFRVTTGDNGYGLVLDMMRSAPRCDDSFSCKTDCCTPGGSFAAVFYFMSFTLCAKLVLLNIVVAILMVQLSDSNEEVLLMAIQNQSDKLDELEGAELLAKLGLDEEKGASAPTSEIMIAKAEREAQAKDKISWELPKDVKKAVSGLHQRK